MKNRYSLSSLSIHITAGVAAVTLLANTHAGFLDLLRGEKPAAPEFQRVAFVGSAKIKAVSGDAEYLSGVERWLPLKAGMTLREGDLIRTHENGSVIVQMTASESLVRVTPKTIMRLLPLEQDWDRSVLSGCDDSEGFCVRAVRGKAEYRSGSNQWRPVSVNTTLEKGTVIRTGRETHIDLFDRSNGKFLRVVENSTVRLGNENRASRIHSQPAVAGTQTSAR